MKRHRLVSCALLLATAELGAAARPGAAPSERRQAAGLSHSFSSSAGSAPDVQLILEPIIGDLRAGAGPAGRQIDSADYTRAGRLIAHRALRLGPLAGGPAHVPAGDYRVSLRVSGSEGLPVLELLAESGLRLRLLLPATSRPVEGTDHLTAEPVLESGGSAAWPVAIHLPTVSGLVVLGPAEGPAPGRRRSRSQVIREALEERTLRGAPVRGQR